MKKFLLFAILFVGLAVISRPGVEASAENNDCPTGSTYITKYEWQGNSWQVEAPANGVTISGNAQSGTWNSTGLVSHLAIKGANNTVVVDVDPDANAGTYNKNVLPANNGGQIPNISHIDFCGPMATPTPTATPTVTPTSTPTATPTSTPVATPFIRVTTMGYCDSEGKNYLRLRNDGSMAVNDAAWKHVNSGLVQSVGSLNPGQFVYFSGPNGQYEGGYIDNGQFVRTHGRSSTNTNPWCPVQPTPTPSATPVVTPTPSATPRAGRGDSFEITGITCENRNFDAKYFAFDNGNPLKGIKVKFEYMNKVVNTETNEQGLAQAGFLFEGVSQVYAYPEGRASRDARIDDTNDICEGGIGGGDVLGVITEQAATTDGQVLGLAATGGMEDILMRLTGILGGGLTTVGSYLYGKKKINA